MALWLEGMVVWALFIIVVGLLACQQRVLKMFPGPAISDKNNWDSLHFHKKSLQKDIWLA